MEAKELSFFSELLLAFKAARQDFLGSVWFMTWQAAILAARRPNPTAWDCCLAGKPDWAQKPELNTPKISLQLHRIEGPLDFFVLQFPLFLWVVVVSALRFLYRYFSFLKLCNNFSPLSLGISSTIFPFKQRGAPLISTAG